jgi:hypothetical protein
MEAKMSERDRAHVAVSLSLLEKNLASKSCWMFGFVLTVSGLLEVDIGIAQGATRDDIATDTDREHWSDCRKLFKEHRLGDVSVQVSYVQ